MHDSVLRTMALVFLVHSYYCHIHCMVETDSRPHGVCVCVCVCVCASAMTCMYVLLRRIGWLSLNFAAYSINKCVQTSLDTSLNQSTFVILLSISMFIAGLQDHYPYTHWRFLQWSSAWTRLARFCEICALYVFQWIYIRIIQHLSRAHTVCVCVCA